MAVINAVPTSPYTVTVGTDDADIINGASNNDVIVAQGGNDQVYGNDGEDLLFGGVGDDLLDGGIGKDTLVGGIGDDNYYIDSASDVVNENAGEGYDTVYTSVSDGGFFYTMPANIERLFMNEDASPGALGNELDNIFIGNDKSNVLYGFDGNDNIYGYGGDDTLFGGNGNDPLIGGDGNDLLLGEGGNDILIGSMGADKLIGGEGNDTLNSFADGASDVLTGEAGADMFALSVVADGLDKITDFSFAEGDKIRIINQDPNITLADFTYDQGSGGLIFDRIGDNAGPSLLATLQPNLGNGFLISRDVDIAPTI
jgi:Ca2+-binding RTX toxin-like protein